MSKAPEPKSVVVDVALVDEDPDNARLVFDPVDLKILGESLKDRQLYAIQVRKLNNGRYQLVDGARRLRAAKLAGIKQLRADDLGGHIDAKTAAILAATANLEREDLTPLEEARAFDRLLKAGLNKKQIGDRFGVPYNTLESRLELLALPDGLARRIGDQRKGAALGLGHAKAFLPFAKHPKLLQTLMQDVDQAMQTEATAAPKPGEMTEFIENSLVKHKLAIRPRDIDQSWEIRDLEGRASKEFDLIELPGRYGSGKERLILDVAGFKKKAEEWRKADRAAEAKRSRISSSSSYGGAMSAAGLAADRLKRATRQQQLQLLAKHLKDHKRFGEELQRRVYQDYVQRLGQVAPSLIDQEAIKEIMGENVLSNGSPNGATVEKLWKTDRAKLDRFLCAMLYMANKEYTTKIVKKDDVARMATGHTWQHAEGLAKMALKAKAAKKAATANLKPGKQARGETPKKGGDAKGKPAPSKKAAPAPTKAPTWAQLQAYAKKHRVAPGSAATRKAVEALTPAQRVALIGDHMHGLVKVDGAGKPKTAAKPSKAAKKPAKAAAKGKAAKKPVVETAAVKKAREKLAAKPTSVIAKGNPGKAKGSQAQLPVKAPEGNPTAALMRLHSGEAAREASKVLEAPLAGLKAMQDGAAKAGVLPGMAVPAKGTKVLDEVGLVSEAPRPLSATTMRLQALAAASKESSVPAAAKEHVGA